MGFRTKLDYSDNRQIIQRENTITALSGKTDFGVAYTGLTGGPNLTSAETLYELTGITSTFSGNLTTTIFNFGTFEMNGGENFLNIITPSNQNDDQIIDEPFFIGVNPSINPYTLQTVYEYYTGSTFDITITNFEEVSPSAFTGTLLTELVTVYSATSADYTGDGVWANVNGKLKTEEIIISKNSTLGYVLTALDVSGNTAWMPSGIGVDGSPYFISGSSGSYSIKAINPTGLDATGNYAFTYGNGNLASGNSSHAHGQNTQAIGTRSHAQGYLTVASGDTSYAEGYNTTANGNYSHVEGYQSETFGEMSHAEGFQTQAIGARSHAEGQATQAIGNKSHSEGHLTVASGDTSHAEGSATTANGIVSHAQGIGTLASGESSHAEGNITIASGYASHAEGYSGQSSGYASHSEGFKTISSADASHSEGGETIASGNFSHAEGIGTVASAPASHAQGHTTIASGEYSHAGGFGAFSGLRNIIASGFGSFNHSTSQNITSNAIADFSAILGGVDNNLLSAATHSVILGGINLTGSAPSTVYVPALNINNVGVGPSTVDIGVDANGNVVNVASDIRLKENITTIEGALEKVLNLRGVTYNWIDRFNGGNDLRMGFIAQEVQNLVPELVYKSNDNIHLGIHYSNTVALLVEAIKELSIKIDNTSIIFYTPTSSNDEKGVEGNTCYDNDFYYVKTKSGWKRTQLNNF